MRIVHKLIVVIVLVGLLAFMLPAAVVSAEEAVNFPDANLEAAIREVIPKPTGDIYPSDLEKLTVLDFSGRTIANVTGLEYCTELLQLSLSNNQIGNISPLAGLTILEQLDLSNNQISDISPLAGLTALEQLTLSNNQISDISVLAGLIHLEYLDLSNNEISDISALVANAGLQEWDIVDLRENELSSYSISISIPQLESRGVTVYYSKKCFIATAAYGTPTANELDVLRAFRDEVLLQNSFGSQLVDLYYDVSPQLADIISEHEPLRMLVRDFLVEPAVWIVETTGVIWRD